MKWKETVGMADNGCFITLMSALTMADRQLPAAMAFRDY